MSRAGAYIGFIVATALLAVPAAQADERIQAGPSIRYTTPNVTMDQGERLTFQNLDVERHDVVASARGSDGRALFRTPIIGNGEEAFVEGSQYLTTGSYGFFCSVHPQMTGTLNVTSAGTPAQRPGPGTGPPDRAKPRVSVKLRRTSARRARRSRRLPVEVTVNEAAKVALRARARGVTVARGSVSLPAAGKRRPSLRLTAAGRRLLGRRGRVAVTLTARAVDRAGNAATARARRTLKP
jgi:plastocyanin